VRQLTILIAILIAALITFSAIARPHEHHFVPQATGKPEEIAELMAFLVSPGARWMTGSTLRMDGGEVKSI
jgi:NAD(P)-dependent dehydrogenase (short-subunit alcohol dehydrogenase family)